MKVIYCILLFISMLLVSCTADEITVSDDSDEVTVVFKTDNGLSTRTTLAGSDNLQHVTYVHLYIFNGTTATSRCIASENANWKQSVGSTATQYYTLESKLPDLSGNTTYTFLAVGLDCKLTNSKADLTTGSAGTYGLPGTIVAGNGTTTGTTLSSAVARLADSKTQSDITISELFAGFREVAVQRGKNTITIDLYRRVAGVLGYFTNIPNNVVDVKLVLYKSQYKNVPLRKKDISDYGTEVLTGSEVLLDFPVSNEILKQETIVAEDFTYTKLPGTVLKGAYMLPLNATTGQNTLLLKTYNSSGTVVRTYSVKLENGTTDFPIVANHFYSLGIKNTTTDVPIDLGGTIDGVVIRVDGSWQADVNIPM